MSVLVVDPDEFAIQKGNPRRNPFVNSRFGYTLIPDLKAGFQQAVRNQQTSLALEYMELIVDVVDNLLTQLLQVAEQSDQVAEIESSTAKSRKVSKATGPQPQESEQEVASS